MLQARALEGEMQWLRKGLFEAQREARGGTKEVDRARRELRQVGGGRHPMSGKQPTVVQQFSPAIYQMQN